MFCTHNIHVLPFANNPFNWPCIIVFQISNQKFLSIGHCNIQGGLSGNLGKTIEIQELIYREKLDLLGINETNLKSTVHNSTLNIPLNYEFLRCDRPNDSGRGGCGILVSKRLKFKEFKIVTTYTDITKIEAVWVELIEQNIIICCFYRSFFIENFSNFT